MKLYLEKIKENNELKGKEIMDKTILTCNYENRRRRGRPCMIYGPIDITLYDIITIIKSNHRMKFINKDDMYSFIVRFIDSDYKYEHSRNEMLYILESFLNENTLYLYEREFDKFGLCKKDLLQLLHIRRSSMLIALEVNNIHFRNLSYHTMSIKKGRYHMFWPSDILRLNNYVPV